MTFRAHWTVFENVIFRWFIRFVIAISALEPFLLHKFNWAVYLYSHDTKSPPTYCPSSNEQQTIVVAPDTALQFCIHKWKQPDFFFVSQINPWSILFFCDSAFFFHSCSQMQISFPSALFILCTLRPFLPRFLINSVSFFRKIIRHPVKTIFLSFVSIMSCFCMGPIYGVFIHRQHRTFFFSFKFNYLWCCMVYLHSWFPYIDRNQGKWIHSVPFRAHAATMYNCYIFIFTTILSVHL